jgi:large subunit ribosomal protein L22
MESRAVSKYLRVAPRKARLVVDMIRGRKIEEALGILEFSAKRAGRPIAKTKRAYVDEGPTLKRFMPRAHGRATQIAKRTSHITIVVDERGP